MPPLRVAYYSPMPPERSGIADYSALLVPALERRIDVDVARRGKRADGDVRLYHIGNDADVHGWIIERLRRDPGVVVLHDFVLHHLVARLTLGRKNREGYRAAMEREAGTAGRALAQGVIDGSVPPLWDTRAEEFPLCGGVVDAATGVVVHSHHVERHLRERRFAKPLWLIPHPAWPVPGVAPERVGGSPVFGAFGNLNPSKRLPQLLAAFAGLRESRPDARLLLVGKADNRTDVKKLPDGVVHVDYVPEERLWALLDGVDAVVSLRWPTMGETSGIAIRALSLGKPLVVSDVGWFSELPDDVALKIAPGDAEVEQLALALEALSDPGMRERMAATSRELAADHDVEHVADRYVSALEEAAGRPRVLTEARR